jgi:hypothetical protein
MDMSQIRKLTDEFFTNIAQVITNGVNEQIGAMIEAMKSEQASPTVAAANVEPVASPPVTPVPAAEESTVVVEVAQAEVAEAEVPEVASKKGSKRKHKTPAHCLHDGCTNPHCGPKYRFLCRDHREPGKKKRAKKK